LKPFSLSFLRIKKVSGIFLPSLLMKKFTRFKNADDFYKTKKCDFFYD